MDLLMQDRYRCWVFMYQPILQSSSRSNKRDCGPNPFTERAWEKVAQNVKGNKLPSAPDFSYNITITQTFYGANGSVDVRIQRSYMGEEGNVFNNPALVVQELILGFKYDLYAK